MVSEEPSSPMANGDVDMAEKTPLSNKKNQGKAPKKIHKAEREKLKRDHLNELFFELGCALEPARQNNGKACILGDATRLLRDLIAQVDSLRKENATLLTESHYVSIEKNELKDENTHLESEISRLHTEVWERMHSDSARCSSTDAAPATFPRQTNTVLPMPQAPVAPFYVLPPHQELQPCPEAETVSEPPKPPSHVSRPRPRYASPSDSWPLELLSRHPRTDQEGHQSSSSTSSLSNGVEGSVETALEPGTN